MPEIDATVSGADANAYLTVDDASELMDSFEHGDDWENLDLTTKERLIRSGSRIIDRFKNWPPRQDAAQRMAFPTSKDALAVLPEEVKTALCEYLDMKAAGNIDGLKELQAEGVTSASVLGQNSTMKEDTSQLPAGARGELEGLWAKYNQPVGKNRPSNLYTNPTGAPADETHLKGDYSVFK